MSIGLPALKWDWEKVKENAPTQTECVWGHSSHSFDFSSHDLGNSLFICYRQVMWEWRATKNMLLYMIKVQSRSWQLLLFFPLIAHTHTLAHTSIDSCHPKSVFRKMLPNIHSSPVTSLPLSRWVATIAGTCTNWCTAALMVEYIRAVLHLYRYTRSDMYSSHTATSVAWRIKRRFVS